MGSHRKSDKQLQLKKSLSAPTQKNKNFFELKMFVNRVEKNFFECKFLAWLWCIASFTFSADNTTSTTSTTTTLTTLTTTTSMTASPSEVSSGLTIAHFASKHLGLGLQSRRDLVKLGFNINQWRHKLEIFQCNLNFNRYLNPWIIVLCTFARECKSYKE